MLSITKNEFYPEANNLRAYINKLAILANYGLQFPSLIHKFESLSPINH